MQDGPSKPCYRIAIVSDFFHPVVGGVENHIYMLAIGLLARGHHVIILTHTHPPSRVGVRHLLPSGLKIYHLPLTVLTSSATLPTFLTFLPYFRNVMLRERIQLVHGHASLSSMAMEAVMHAPMIKGHWPRPVRAEGDEEEEGWTGGGGIRTVFTDHSLFGFADATGILTNKLLIGALRNVEGVVCVSHTGRENTVLRAALDPGITHVIPNAVLPSQFTPSPQSADPNCITVVVVSRLVYRKGVDLLVASAPHICRLFPDVRFVIGGDGPKMVELEQMREKYLLQDRIELMGNIAPRDVRSVLIRGQIFLNTSLTEAFGTAILEAASTGLLVVSTKVGGVPEVLPEDMIIFAQPNEDDVINSLSLAIQRIRKGDHDPVLNHERVKGMYSWDDVARRTELVYRGIVEGPEQRGTFERMIRLLDTGPFWGLIMLIIFSVQHLFFYSLEWAFPRGEIDYVPLEARWDQRRMEKLRLEELEVIKERSKD